MLPVPTVNLSQQVQRYFHFGFLQNFWRGWIKVLGVNVFHALVVRCVLCVSVLKSNHSVVVFLGFNIIDKALNAFYKYVKKSYRL
jgi:hypothetical protein